MLKAMPPAVRRWPPPTCGAKWGRSAADANHRRESDPVTTVGDAHFLQQQIPASRWWFWRHRICLTLRRRKLYFGAAELFRGTPWMINSAIRTGWRYGAKYGRPVDRTLQHLTPLNDEFQDFITRYARGETGRVRGSITIPAA